MKIEWLVTDVKPVEFPDRAEHAILRVIFRDGAARTPPLGGSAPRPGRRRMVTAYWARNRPRRGAGYASSLAGDNSNQVVFVLKTLLGLWGREIQRSWVLYWMCIYCLNKKMSLIF